VALGVEPASTLVLVGDAFRTDATSPRDYVYVGDVVEAFVATADRAEAVGARLNISTAVETSVLELYAALKRVTGFRPEPELAPAVPASWHGPRSTRAWPRVSSAGGRAPVWPRSWRAPGSGPSRGPGEAQGRMSRRRGASGDSGAGSVWHRRALSGRFAVAERP